MRDSLLESVRRYLKALPFADRVQVIQNLLKIVIESLDGMEAEVAKECP